MRLNEPSAGTEAVWRLGRAKDLRLQGISGHIPCLAELDAGPQAMPPTWMDLIGDFRPCPSAQQGLTGAIRPCPPLDGGLQAVHPTWQGLMGDLRVHPAHKV